MAYRWHPTPAPLDVDAYRTDGLEQQFDSQEAAEAWLSEFFDLLAEHGITDVTLMEEDRTVYGPMSLLP